MGKIFIFISSLMLVPALLSAAPTLHLEKKFKSYALGKNLDILEDPKGKLSIDDVTTPELSHKFVPSQKETPNFGFSGSVYWVRTAIANSAGKAKEVLLEIGYPHHDRITLYLPNPDASSRRKFIQKEAGDLKPFKEREIQHKLFLFKLHFHPGESQTIFLRFETEGSVQIPLSIWDSAAFTEKVNDEQFYFGIYYGIILVMLLYNLFLFFGTGDKPYLHYVLYLFCFMLAQMSLNGLAFEYLWPNLPVFHSFTIVFFVFLSMFFGYLFCKSFLNTREHLPLLDKILSACMLISLSGIGVFFIRGYAPAVKMLGVTGVLFFIPNLTAGILSLRKGVPAARYYIFAWVVFLFGIMFFSLRNMGILDQSFFTTYAMQIGSSLEVTLLSLGLAARINTMKKEKYLAQQEALAAHKEALEAHKEAMKNLEETNRIKSEFMTKLENMVEKRTEELHAAMEEMEAINNSLTETNSKLEHAHTIAERDMRMAKNVQTKFLPGTVPLNDEWDIAYYFMPMSGVSGDFYDFYMIDDSFKGLGIFDVSGHGIASGLITMIAKLIIYRNFSQGLDIPLNTVLSNANEELVAEIGNVDNYLTGIILKIMGNSIEYVNAGHPDIFIKSKGSAYQLLNENNESTAGPFLGLPHFKLPYDSIRFTVSKDDYILLYTDCLMESHNKYKEEYGIERVLSSLEKAPEGSASETLDFILNEFHKFRDRDEYLNDDLTLIVMKKK
ncbi:MAG: SpoIIE family protein phosphatase [bacterium]|nr:SpoIIE family protein phosphatase [bacterium]